MRIWTTIALVSSTVIVSAVSLVVLRHPQLDPDDFRYLASVRELEADFVGALPDAFVVENRWDHIWWLDAEKALRFFRPTVVLSYWVDTIIYSDRDMGLLLTNVLLHLACTWLCWLILARLIGPGEASLLGTLLFAALFCHGEVIWYVAGRTDTLAALGFLAALGAHLHFSEQRGWRRLLSVPFFAFALFSKELTIVLPLVCLVYDLWVERWSAGLRNFWKERGSLYIAYGVVAAVYLSIRWWVLSGGEEIERGWVYPYLVLPKDPAFPMHVWTQLRVYAESLLLARPAPPFLQPVQLTSWVSTEGLVASLVGIGLLGISVFRDRRAHFLLAMAILVWLPTSVAYISERYLYLPSVALVGILALAVDRWRGKRVVWAIALVGVISWGTLHAVRLWERNSRIATWDHRSVAEIGRLFAPVSEGLPPGVRLLVLDFPLDWLSAQFLEPILQDQLADPELGVRVLSQSPPGWGPAARLQLRRSGETGLVVERGLGLLDGGPSLFARVDCETDSTIERPVLGFSVQVLDGSQDKCSRVAFDFDAELDKLVFVWFRPAGLVRKHPLGWEAPGSFEILSVPPI